jgi:hypothetical protein
MDKMMIVDILFYGISFILFIILLFFLFRLIVQKNFLPKNLIEKNFEELKKSGLIEQNRKLIQKNDKVENFGAGIFRKVIFYNKKNVWIE